MRIDELHVEGFGTLSNLSFTDIPKGLAIIVGDNEAGKTTLLAFLRAVLFGLPNRLQKDFYPTVGGIRKGGRILVSNDQISGVMVERHEGTGTGQFKLTFPGGAAGAENEFLQFIGSATENLYKNVFAFGLAELRQFEKLNTEEVSAAMYSAGLGAGQRTLPEVMAQIKKQRSDLFLPGGTKPELNVLLKKIEQVALGLRGHAMDQDEFERIHDDLQDCDQKIRKISDELVHSRARQSYIKLLCNAWEQWIELNDSRDRLALLPVIENFPESGIQRLDILTSEKKGFEDQSRELRGKRNVDQESAEHLQVDHNLLQVAAEITELERRLDVNAKNSNDLLAQGSDCQLQEQQLQKALSELGDEWDEEKLRNFDLSVAAREEFDRCRQNLVDASHTEREQQLKHVQQHKHYQEVVAHQTEVSEKLKMLPEPNVALKVDSIKNLQAGLESYLSARQDLPVVEVETRTRFENLEDTLRTIGPDWDEAKLASFDASITVQQQVSSTQKQLADLDSREVITADRLEDALAAHKDVKLTSTRIEESIAALPQIETEDESFLSGQVTKIRGLRRALAENEKRSSDSNHLQERKQDHESRVLRLQEYAAVDAPALPRWLAPLLLSIGIAGAVAFGLVNGSWMEGAVLFAVMLAIAGFVTIWKPEAADAEKVAELEADNANEITQLEQSIDELTNRVELIRASIEATELEIIQHANNLTLDGSLTQQRIDEFESHIEHQISMLRERRPLEQQLAEHQQNAETIQERVITAKEESERVAQALDLAQQKWQALLHEIRLPNTLSPETANHILTRLDAAREQLKEIRRDRARIALMKEKVLTFEQQVRDAALGSGVERLLPAHTADGKITEKKLEMLTTYMAQAGQQTRALDEQQRRLVECQQEMVKEKRKEAELSQEYSATQEKRLACEDQWTGLLKKLGLALSLAGDTAGPVFQAIVTARDKYDGVVRLRGQRSSTQKLITEYRENVRLVLQKINRSMPETADVAVIVPHLASEVRQAEEALRELDSLNEKMAEADVRIRQVDEGRSKRQQEIQALFDTAGSRDEETFRRGAADYEARQDIQKTIENIEIQLRNQIGRDKEFKSLEGELEQTTQAQLQQEVDELALLIRELEESRREATDERGRFGQQLDSLERSEEVSRLRAEHQSGLSLLQSKAEEWAIMRITEYLINRAREKYETERRPGVLKKAESYFKRLTRGAYTSVQAPLGDEEIVVRSKDGIIRRLDQLSTATAEQLYLSLRFGFVKEFIARSESLPLIFDDILVNFDPGRARAAGEAIIELSESLQTLFFTCHPATVDLLKDIDPCVPVFKLSSGELSPQPTNKT